MTVNTTRTIEVTKTELVIGQSNEVARDKGKCAGTSVGAEATNVQSKTRKTVPWYEGYRPGYFC